MFHSKNILGPETDIDIIIEAFYSKLVKDDRVRDFFTIVDLEAVKRKQINFFNIILSDDDKNVQNYMKTSHTELVNDFGLNDNHFNALHEVLAETLCEFRIEENYREKLLGKMEQLRPHVLCK